MWILVLACIECPPLCTLTDFSCNRGNKKEPLRRADEEVP